MLARFLARNRVSVTAHRSDMPFEPPDRVETLLAAAAYIEIHDHNHMTVHQRGSSCFIYLSEVRVHFPDLVAELRAAGLVVPIRSTKQAKVRAHMAQLPPGVIAGMTDKMIAQATGASERTVRRTRTS
jgi:hypothetical protein